MKLSYFGVTLTLLLSVCLNADITRAEPATLRFNCKMVAMMTRGEAQTLYFDYLTKKVSSPDADFDENIAKLSFQSVWKENKFFVVAENGEVTIEGHGTNGFPLPFEITKDKLTWKTIRPTVIAVDGEPWKISIVGVIELSTGFMLLKTTTGLDGNAVSAEVRAQCALD